MNPNIDFYYNKGRVFSSYAIPSEIDRCGDKLYVITESGWSSNKDLVPKENKCFLY